jgi:cytochrome P450
MPTRAMQTKPLDSVDFAFDELPGHELHDVLRDYREKGPIQPTRFMGQPAFVITEHEALSRAFQDDFRFPGYKMYAAGFEPAIGPSFISNPDPKEHLAYRKLATPAFRSRAVSTYEKEGLAALAHELLDEIADHDRFDLVTGFTSRFPYLVITRLLGLPREREQEFHDWALALLTFRDDPARAMRAREALSKFLSPVVEDRRRAPQNDIISELIAAEIDGRKLTDEEICSHIRLLFPTGGETTHGSLGNLLYALFSTEGAWQRICREPGCIERAVAEGLRWETPIAVLPRVSQNEPIEFEGMELPADSWVLFAAAGANRDPALLPDPDRFDIDRSQPPNLTFGRGAKSCPGTHLARKNMSVAIEVLSHRLPGIELLDHEIARPRRTVLRCPESLPMRRI